MSVSEHWRKIASPALFARTASKGRWKAARHLMAIDEALVEIAAGRLKHLVIEMPPRHGKTELIARWFPAWYLGLFPDKQVIYVSNQQRRASKYGRFVRNALNEHGWMFPVKVAQDSSAAVGWAIEGHEGGMQAAGVHTELSGEGASVLIVDDPIGNSSTAFSEIERDNLWEWFQSTASTRVEPEGAIILIMHRWHGDDMAARFKEQYKEQGIKILSFPAIGDDGAALWPERWPLAKLIARRETVSPYWWNALYQQNPTRQGQAAFPDEYFNYEGFWFTDWPDCSPRVVSLDPSKGRTDRSDFSAFVALGAGVNDGGDLYCQADIARRPTPKIVEDAIQILLDVDPASFTVEDAGYQNLILPLLDAALAKRSVPRPERFRGLSHENINKEIRIHRIAPFLANRIIHFHDDPMTRLLVQQLREFPLGSHDDGPDALEMAIRDIQIVADGGMEPVRRPPPMPLEYR
jgi:predicted phage terminase large subunit-like protein